MKWMLSKIRGIFRYCNAKRLTDNLAAILLWPSFSHLLFSVFGSGPKNNNTIAETSECEWCSSTLLMCQIKAIPIHFGPTLPALGIKTQMFFWLTGLHKVNSFLPRLIKLPLLVLKTFWVKTSKNFSDCSSKQIIQTWLWTIKWAPLNFGSIFFYKDCRGRWRINSEAL